MFGSVHRASSASWGEKSVARLCKIVVDSNSHFLQEVMNGKTDYLDMLTYDELLDTDDLGINLVFLCVYFDRPEMLLYLSKRGFDMSIPCDPMNYGNAMFYAGM
jgi:hypothetical protein